jgi:hypothetical protein
MMDIDDIARLREELQDSIAEALAEFEAKSSMEVECVEIRRLDKVGHKKSSILDVRIQVKL